MRLGNRSYVGGVKCTDSRELDVHWCRPDKYDYRALRTSAKPSKGAQKEARAAQVAEHERLPALLKEHCPASIDMDEAREAIGLNPGAPWMYGGVFFELDGAVYLNLGIRLCQAVSALPLFRWPALRARFDVCVAELAVSSECRLQRGVSERGQLGSPGKLRAAASAMYVSGQSAEQLAALGRTAADLDEEDVEVWPCNWPAFLSNVHPMTGGHWRRSRSRPQQHRDVVSFLGIKEKKLAEIFPDLQVLEGEALRVIARHPWPQLLRFHPCRT
ncbi:DUF1799 domain-containing protein [Pseudomonas sp. Q1]|uniref:DUF1799 domain-containing protein n=1 Tax=Pseudomonas sp. Q1 TaxID=2202823 RepID=UPI002114D6DE|nr:DUF1799 domain-containing protein [Pseudomonas sp. Q1]